MQLSDHTHIGVQGKGSGSRFWQTSLRKLQGVSHRKSANLVGLDIGTTAITMVQLTLCGQSVSLERFGVQRVHVFADPEKSRHQPDRLKHAIQELIRTCDIQQKYVAVSLSGASVIIKRIEFPPLRVEEVEGYLTWEGSRHLPFDMDEVYWDNHPILTQGPQASGNQVRSAFVYAAKRKTVEDLQDVVLEAGLRPVVCDVNVVALSNMYVMTHPITPDGLVLLVNIADHHLNMCVMNQKQVVWMRDAPIRCPQYEEALPQAQLVVDEIIGEVKRTMEYLAADESSQLIQKVIFYGNLREQHNLQIRVQADLGLTTECGNPFLGIKIDSLPSWNQTDRDLASFAAIGVGLAGRKRGDR